MASKKTKHERKIGSVNMVTRIAFLEQSLASRAPTVMHDGSNPNSLILFGNNDAFSKVWRMFERNAKMTRNTVLNGI